MTLAHQLQQLQGGEGVTTDAICRYAKFRQIAPLRVTSNTVFPPNSEAQMMHSLAIEIPTLNWEQHRGKFRNNLTKKTVCNELKDWVEVEGGQVYLKRKKHQNPSRVAFAECGGRTVDQITPQSSATAVKDWLDARGLGVEALVGQTGRQVLDMSVARLQEISDKGHIIHASLRGRCCVLFC